MRRKTLVTGLFGCMHFFSFSYLLLGTLLSFYDGPCEVGYSIYVSYVAVSAALYLTFGLVAALRVYAINGRNWHLSTVILVLSLLGPATDVVHCVSTYQTVVPPPVGCVIALSNEDLANKLQIATRACNVAVDALVLLATWRVTYRVVRAGWSAQLKVSVTSLLLRDGSIYFGVLFILNMLNATLWLTNVYDNMTVFSNVFSIILLSHFFLDLRKTALNPSDGTTAQTSHMSDLRFSSALGNLGSAVAGSSTQYTERSDDLEWFETDSETYELSDSYAGLDSTGPKPEATSVSLASGSGGSPPV